MFIVCLGLDDLVVYLGLKFVMVSFRVKIMYSHFNERSGLKAPLIADDVYEIIMKVPSSCCCYFKYLQCVCFRLSLLKCGLNL